MTHIAELRAELMATLKDLRTNKVNLDVAREVSRVASVLVDSARVEVDYLKATGQDTSNFLDGLKTPQAVAAIESAPYNKIETRWIK